LTPGICGWDGSAWRKLPLVWGYSDRWVEYVTSTASGGGNASVDSAAVDTGLVHVLQFCAVRHNAGANKHVEAYLKSLTEYIPLFQDLAAVTDTWYPFTVNGVLKATDRVSAIVVAPGDGKAIYLRMWGYKMKVAE